MMDVELLSSKGKRGSCIFPPWGSKGSLKLSRGKDNDCKSMKISHKISVDKKKNRNENLDNWF